MRASAAVGTAPSAERAFRALADPTRLRIVRLLLQGPLCVGDLVTVLRVPQPAVSRHLAYLRGSGLVDDERRGAFSFYGLALQGAFQQALLACVASGDALDQRARKDLAALAALRRAGGCCPQHQRRPAGRSNGQS